MKLRELTLSAWGPYKDQITINFENFKDNGLFLLTGPTGSGKTAIFDGISFALFGALSGNIREKDSMRSDFASENQETFAELSFEHHNKFYRIRRCPRYTRKKKRGSGEILENEKATFYLPDKKVIDKVSDVNIEIEALLGINHHQFKQIAMIAQGEFQEMLVADSSKRAEIFRNIFGTEIFKQIQMNIGEMAKKLYIEISNISQRLDEQRKSIITDGSEVLENHSTSEYPNYEQCVNDLKLQNLEDKRQLKSLEKEVDCQQHLGNILRETVNAYEYAQTQYNHKLTLQNECENSLKELQQLLIERKSDYDEIPNLKKKEKELAEQLVHLKYQLEQLEKIEKQCAKVNLTKQTWNDYAQKYVKDEEIFDSKKNALISDLQDTSLSVQALKVLFQSDLDIQLKKQVDLNEKVRTLKDLENTISLYNQQNELSLNLEREMEAQRHVYKENDILKRMESAGVLAQNLKFGDACPVCGSTTHPHLAHMSEKIVDEHTLEKMKISMEEAENVYQKATIELEVLRQKIKLQGEHLQLDSADMQNIDSLIEKSQIQISEINIACDQLKQKQKILVDLENLETVLKEEKKILAEKLSDLKKEEAILCELQTADYPKDKTYQELQIENRISKKQYEMIQSDIQKYEKDYLNVIQKKVELEARLKEIKEQTRELLFELKEREDCLEKVYGQLPEAIPKEQSVTYIENQVKSLREMEKQIDRRYKVNKDILQKLKDYLAKKVILDEKYGKIKNLEDVSKGKNEKKMEFEQYVLSSYFEKILIVANKRLDKMTEGRYELLRAVDVSDRRKKSGLDIEVLDHYTGKTRSVKSLSGGESFKTALALALGLSDVIVSQAGGIEIDMLFIDEGFGSLDEQSLQSAVDTLMSLSNSHYMIGIISHVAELKDTISRKIIVEKTTEGSSIKLEM